MTSYLVKHKETLLYFTRRRISWQVDRDSTPWSHKNSFYNTSIYLIKFHSAILIQAVVGLEPKSANIRFMKHSYRHNASSFGGDFSYTIQQLETFTCRWRIHDETRNGQSRWEVGI